MEERPTREACLVSRLDPRDDAGFYESYFQRGNHPTRALAFWIRYTVFVPKGRPDRARGELWAIYFDGERKISTVVKQDHPLADCLFSRAGFDVRVGAATLGEDQLDGRAVMGAHAIAWSLGYRGEAAPLLLLPASLYAGAFPKAKSLVATPHARYHGSLVVDGERIFVEGWPGSQNHNWGSRHTDHYLWGQVCGFDEDETAFLECASARVRIGPLLSPVFTVIVLRIGEKEYRMNGLLRALRAETQVDGFDWRLSSAARGVTIAAHLHAQPSQLVGLGYDNPPGGRKTCLNTKLAAAEVTLARPGERPLTLTSAHRAAFELLSDAGDARIALRV